MAYLGTRQASRYSNALSRYQETLRYAKEKMTEDIRMAGSTGCFQIRKMGVFISNYNGTAMPSDLSFTQAIQGYENTGATWSPVLSAITPSKGDALQVKYADPNGFPLNVAMASSAGPLVVTTGTQQFNNNDIAIVEECDKADVFQIATATGTGTQTLTLSSPLSSGYPAGAIPVTGVNVHKFIDHYWSIQTSASSGLPNVLTRTSVVGPSSPAPTYTAEDMVDGVEDMQITYGEDTSGTGSPGSITQATQFRTADLVSNWSNVISVRVCLLTVSSDNGLTTSNSYFDCNNSKQTSSDLKLRFPFYIHRDAS